MLSILIIEDHPDLLYIVRQGLNHFGYSVETAVNGEEGLLKFKNGCFDLVVTDFLMPDINGHTVLQSIRAEEKNYTPVICMTGTPWQPEHDDFDGLIRKPFTILDLVDTIADVRRQIRMYGSSPSPVSFHSKEP